MKVVAFFVVIAALFCAWRVAARGNRKAAKKIVCSLAVPTLLAALITLGLLAFAFTFNGKLI